MDCDFEYTPDLTLAAVKTWPARGSTLDSTEVRVAVAGSFDASSAQVFFGEHECDVTATSYMGSASCPACDPVGGRCLLRVWGSVRFSRI